MSAGHNKQMSHQEHQQAGKAINARCAVITLSDTRSLATDRSGAEIKRLLQEAGHTVQRYQLIPDEPSALADLLNQCLADKEVDLILSTGGTGISPRDQTIGVIERLIEIPLSGFGELFRMLSWQQIGSSAMLSRATAGIAQGKPIFAMPGSTAAVQLAMQQLILPEIGHMLMLCRK
jgi:molybdenum cofactor biosynthesis protein B